MKTDTQAADDVVLAEAAAWIARLQGSERTAAAEAAFKEWLGADSAHARAFARATDVWEVIPGAARFKKSAAMPMHRELDARPSSRWRVAAMAATVAVVSVAVGFYQLRTPTYITAVGQQQTITLDDGTRVFLNTDSQVSVVYTGSERRLYLKRGEALFQVAKDASRPLIVDAGSQQVRALGTSFVVRRQEASVAVTLIDGLVEVRPTVAANPGAGILLAPGQRLTLQPNVGKAMDTPKVEAVTAWQRGEVMFDDVSLQDAIAEINRYGKLQVAMADPALGRLRVSGVFETRDPREFAHAMARLHGLTVAHADADILLLNK